MMINAQRETKKATINRDFYGDMAPETRVMVAPEPVYQWPDFSIDNKAHAMAKAEFGVTDCSNLTNAEMSAIASRAQEIKDNLKAGR